MLTHFVFVLAIILAAPFMNRKRHFFVFSFMLLFIFLALRYNFGNDYMAYRDMYGYVHAGLYVYVPHDILYRLLNLYSPSFYALVAITSLIYIVAIYMLIKKNLPVRLYWMALLILLLNPYLFLIHLSAMRQTLAICFVVFAIQFAVKRQPIPYILMILVATGFHKSAIIILPLYFFLTASKIKTRWLVMLIGGVFALVFTPALDIILRFAFRIFPQYEVYYKFGQSSGLRTALISGVLFLIVICNINRLEGRAMVYGKLALIAVSISMFAVRVVMIARVGMYFDIFLIVALPSILEKMNLKVNREIVFCMILAIYGMRYLSFFLSPEWSPYYGNYQTVFGALPF